MDLRNPSDHEPMIRGESAYDRVTSMLISLVVGTSLIVGWLWTMYCTSRAYARPIPPPIRILEVEPDGGWRDGDESAIVELEPRQPSAEDARTFEDIPIPEASPRALDPFVNSLDRDDEQGEVLDRPERGPTGDGAGDSSTTRTAGRSYGIDNKGGGGVRREERWIFDFPAGQTEEEYAKLLDSLGVELATPAGPKMVAYASRFTGTPAHRTDLAKSEKRIYFVWSNEARRKFDISLLRKAGVRVEDNAIILQFLPDAVQDRLAKLEFGHRNRPPAEIRRTRFRVIAAGDGFDFRVSQQEYLK